MPFRVVEHLLPQVSVGGMELEKSLPQSPFVMCHGDDLPTCFPDPDLPQRIAVQQAMVVHILPGRLDPIPVRVSRLVVPDQEVVHALIVLLVIVLATYDIHVKLRHRIIDPHSDSSRQQTALSSSQIHSAKN